MHGQQCTQAMHASIGPEQCRTDGRTDGLTEMAGKRGAMTYSVVDAHARIGIPWFRREVWRMTERTFVVSCPRCGAAVTAHVHRSDVRVRVVDASSFAGYREVMHGLEAEVNLLAEHVCARPPMASEGQR